MELGSQLTRLQLFDLLLDLGSVFVIASFWIGLAEFSAVLSDAGVAIGGGLDHVATSVFLLIGFLNVVVYLVFRAGHPDDGHR